MIRRAGPLLVKSALNNSAAFRVIPIEASLDAEKYREGS